MTNKPHAAKITHYRTHKKKAEQVQTYLTILYLSAKLTGDTEPWIGHIIEDSVVLLLHIGNDIKHWVDVVWSCSHGQACDAPCSAVD